MTKIPQTIRPCPCGSRRTLQACCGPLLAGRDQAETALALMRSRYTANVLKAADYLLQTWHPSTRPETLEFPPALRWIGLTICSVQAGDHGDSDGKVEFIASFRERGRPGKLHETSRFVREQGRWLYLDGELH
ncbi:MAG: hypothetical protein GX093_00875 [Xanthomonadaceae bacterium]|nr:hypothetical protein [Xanthomonadaceae bacterium]